MIDEDRAHNDSTTPILDIPTGQRRNIGHITSFLDSALHLRTHSSELTINMAGKVLPSIETGGDPSSANGSVLSDDTYIEGTPEPDDLEAWLDWGRERNGEDWYREKVACREAAQRARCQEEEREWAEHAKLEAIRKLQKTDPWEGERQMRENNLQLQGFTQAQIDASYQPLPLEEVESNWEGFLQGRVLQPATTEERANARMIRRRSKQAAPATNVKVLSSKCYKTRQRRECNQVRASRRLTGEPPEFNLFTQLHDHFLRNPSTRKRSPAGPRNKKSNRSRARKASKGLLRPR